MADSQAYTLSCTGTDGVAEAAITITGVNDAPVAKASFQTQNATEDSGFLFRLPADSFTDGNGDTLSFTAMREDGTPLPAWLRFDPVAQLFEGTPDWPDAGTLKLKIVATDSRSATGFAPLTVQVTPTSLIPRDVSGRLFLAGTWQPIAKDFFRPDYRPLTVVNSYVVLPLGAARRHGVALNGWAYSGFAWEGAAVQPDTTPVDAVLLEQTANGHLRVATRDYIASSRTNGGQSVFASDVNSDGTLDVLLLAHNESPFIAKPSTVFMSNGSGFTNVKLADAVMAHDAQLVSVAGRDRLYTMSFLTSNTYPDLPRGLFNPRYDWTTDGRFSWQEEFYAGGGMSITAGDLPGNGSTWLAVGDNVTNGYPGIDQRDNTFFRIAIFDEANPNQPLTRLMPYFSARSAYSTRSSLWGQWVTHIPRLWTDDFNHDGNLDLLASTSMWPENLSMLQMLQNQGDGIGYADRTDTLNRDYDPIDGEVDYSMQRVDVDGSGVLSYLLGNAGMQQSGMRRNYVLLNDGTGQLHVLLKDEFDDWCRQAATFANINSTQCQMIGYPNDSDRYNFVAKIDTLCRDAAVDYPCFAFISVATDLDLVKAYKKPVTVTDRNGSRRIRTFGGDDSIARLDSDPDASVDGGAGIDVAVYPHASTLYDIVRGAGVVEIRLKPGGARDTLRNVELARFSDRTIDLREDT